MKPDMYLYSGGIEAFGRVPDDATLLAMADRAQELLDEVRDKMAEQFPAFSWRVKE